jgi:hypothetical protein
MNSDFNHETIQSQTSTSGIEIKTLNIEELDVEELEHRLELATVSFQAQPCLIVTRWESSL